MQIIVKLRHEYRGLAQFTSVLSRFKRPLKRRRPQRNTKRFHLPQIYVFASGAMRRRLRLSWRHDTTHPRARPERSTLRSNESEETLGRSSRQNALETRAKNTWSSLFTPMFTRTNVQS